MTEWGVLECVGWDDRVGCPAMTVRWGNRVGCPAMCGMGNRVGCPAMCGMG